MKKMIITLLLTVVAMVSNAQLKSTNYIYEMKFDSVSYLSFNLFYNNYQVDSISTTINTIRVVEYNEKIYIEINDELIYTPLIHKKDGQILLTKDDNNSTIFSLLIAGIFVTDNYSEMYEKYMNITFYRIISTKHYYGEEFENEFHKYKKRIKKIEKKEKKTKDI